jgi:hypothetical protein
MVFSYLNVGFLGKRALGGLRNNISKLLYTLFPFKIFLVLLRRLKQDYPLFSNFLGIRSIGNLEGKN